jgi:hypothetical protein
MVLPEPKQENPVSLTWPVPSGVLRAEPATFRGQKWRAR